MATLGLRWVVEQVGQVKVHWQRDALSTLAAPVKIAFAVRTHRALADMRGVGRTLNWWLGPRLSGALAVLLLRTRVRTPLAQGLNPIWKGLTNWPQAWAVL